MARAWLNLLVLGTIATVAGGCEIQAQTSAPAEGSFERTLQVNGPANLDVYSRSGRIHVKAGSDDAVHVSATIRAYGSFNWLRMYTAAEQVRLIAATPPVEQSGNRISIGTFYDPGLSSNVTINYDVTVPANARLRTTSRSGDQLIEAIAGPITANSRSGSVQIGGVPGSLDVDTRSGDIDLAGAQNSVRAYTRSGEVRIAGAPSQAWRVETRSGNVVVQLPPDSGAELVVDSRSGSVESSRPVEMRASESRNRMHGIIGSGGKRLEIQTRSGSVRIR